MIIKILRSNMKLFGSILFLIYCFHMSSVMADDWVYHVRKGDNLWNLTKDYLIDYSYVGRVQKLNKIKDPKHVLPGTKIRIPSAWINHYPMLVRVQNLQGMAYVANDDRKHPQQLKVGMILIVGDMITTEADSTLVLGFLDGSQILLQENSRLKIENLMLMDYTGMADIQFELEAGRVETQVTPNKGTAHRFIIKTPATVTSVRGTDYRVSSEQKKKQSRAEVMRGKVQVAGFHKSELVAAGYGTLSTQEQGLMPPVKLLPPPEINSLPDQFGQVPIQFSMLKTEKVQGYRFQIAKSQQFNDVIFDKLFYSDIIRGPDLPDGKYYIRLRAMDENQLEGENVQTQITINARPEAPFLIYPKPGDGILLDDQPTFIWSSQKNVSTYHLQVSDSRNFSRLLVNKEQLTDNEIAPADKMAIGKYFWRVAAADKDGDGPFSDAQMFRRILPAPELEPPEITEETLMIRSRRGLPGQRYHFQMSEDDSFEQLMVDKYSETPGFEIPRPSGGEYFIRVRTIDPDGFVGPFATAQSIKVPYNLLWLMTLLPLLALIAL